MNRPVRLFSLLILGALVMSMTDYSFAQQPEPPIAKIVPKADTMFGDIRVDNYFWMRDRDNPEVIDYLEAENAYTDAVMKHTEEFQEKLFEEIKSRIKETDVDVPVKIDDYYYYSRSEEGKQYKIYCRKKGSLDSPEQVLVDPNELAGDHKFFDIGAYSVSDDHNFIAYTVDTTGYENYTAYFKNLRTGKYLPDTITVCDNEVIWANDNKTVFYITFSEVNLPNKIWSHKLGEDTADDVMKYHEKDDRFYLYAYKTKSKSHIILGLSSKITSEVYYLDANKPNGDFKVISPRTKDLRYQVTERGGRFYILTNADGAKNYKVVSVSVKDPARKNWTDFIAYRDEVKIEDFEEFKNYFVAFERIKGVVKVRVLSYNKETDYHIDFPESIYRVRAQDNEDINADLLRFYYMSYTTPRSIYDYNLKTKDRELLKQYEVLGDFNSDDYQAELIYAKAKDGVEVPVSFVYKKGLKKDGSNPMVLSGYGSYGISSDPYFSSIRLSLLNRGFIVGIAHIRGGGEMGEQWYEDGKFLKKMNTFTDFIACAEKLIQEGYTSKDKLIAWDGSAGGLTVGAVANMRPDLFYAIVASVPFVDVLNTMLDETIPLTVLEYDEWGNPNNEKYYWYLKSYSPYDNVAPHEYPYMLIECGLNDTRVQYWEAAKWAAKLRATKTDNKRLLLKTNMGAGHQGASGRYDYYKEIAFSYTWILDLFGLAK